MAALLLTRLAIDPPSVTQSSFVYSVWDGLQYAAFAKVPTPSGLALSASTLYAASHANGHIYAFDRVTAILLDVRARTLNSDQHAYALVGPRPWAIQHA